ncbi:MAG: response regulator [Steroidobacteraceae bacterium]
MSAQNNSLQHIAALVRPARHHDLTNSPEESAQLYAFPGERRHTPSSPPLTGTSIEPTRILIVDAVQSAVSLRRILRGLGYWTTQIAASGAAALEMARSFSPSIALLCLDLPDMSAYELAEQLRDGVETRRLRLIALTGDYAHAGRDEARQAGFERYLAKPVNVPDLRQLLRAKLA